MKSRRELKTWVVREYQCRGTVETYRQRLVAARSRTEAKVIWYESANHAPRRQCRVVAFPVKMIHLLGDKDRLAVRSIEVGPLPQEGPI
jgi:hypothetical protein